MSQSDGFPTVPAGWYPDPSGTPGLRWWDGARWTEHRSAPAGSGQVSPASPTSYAPAAPARAPMPEGSSALTPFIWVVVFAPIVPALAMLLVDWRQYLATSLLHPYAAMLSPAYLLTLLLGWASYAAGVVFAWLDHKALRAKGLNRPFHWAWAFLGALVYVIGRAVVTHRAGGRDSLVPIWALIASTVLSMIVAIVAMVQIFAATAELLQGHFPLYAAI